MSENASSCELTRWIRLLFASRMRSRLRMGVRTVGIDVERP